MKALPLDAARIAGQRLPAIRRITTADLTASLQRGLADFRRRPTHLVFLAAIYPLAGIAIALAATNANAFPILFPLVAGFALVGPVAALGFYEISRREERGEHPSWREAFAVPAGPARGAIGRVALALLALFALWLLSAQALFSLLAPPIAAPSYAAFLEALLATPAGWALLVLGHAVGFLFAAVAFSIGALSLPLILDRGYGAGEAMAASVAAVRANPLPMAVWAAMVAGLVMLGSLPLLVGLAVVLPVLGHATWHLYRRVMG
ncbi:DUF2189 domain-containing protein [Aureimonas flava]|uniref:DUF2189 domain-containing protein n=1 Tax=Aureimonas flava TaxID=2320271 RepID=A0A3A1WRE2_9HYPH|nr:DUF2189 domain-containing protein [Aureimonas flava]RIY02800.1 DUF2189 domain-containing protein [Aureimonas flava]